MGWAACLRMNKRGFPGVQWLRPRASTAGGSIPGQETKIPLAEWLLQKKNKKQNEKDQEEILQ